MPHSKREIMAVERRRAKVAELFLQGVPQFEIARRLGRDASSTAGRKMVSVDLRAIREQWKQSALRDFDEARGKLLEEIALVKREAWAAWERSKLGKTATRDKKLLNPIDRKKQCEQGHQEPEMVTALVEHEERTEKRDGDPRFPALILDCIQEEASLLGLAVKPGETTSSPPVVAFRIHVPSEDSKTREDDSPNEKESETA